jgi:hypothetical protein
MQRLRFLQRHPHVGDHGHGDVHPAVPGPDHHRQRIGQGHDNKHARGDQLREDLLGHLSGRDAGNAHGQPGLGLLLHRLAWRLLGYGFLHRGHDGRRDRHGHLQEDALVRN